MPHDLSRVVRGIWVEQVEYGKIYDGYIGRASGKLSDLFVESKREIGTTFLSERAHGPEVCHICLSKDNRIS